MLPAFTILGIRNTDELMIIRLAFIPTTNYFELYYDTRFALRLTKSK